MTSGIALSGRGKKYCLDTSGLSNPLVFMPEDIHVNVWAKIEGVIADGRFAVTKEIYDELLGMPGSIGQCIKHNCSAMQLEVGEPGWDWRTYIDHVNRLREFHKARISEYNNNSKGTIGLNDVSIVALALTLKLPVVSMESKTFQTNDRKIRIPGLCALEGVRHMDFNDFLRAESIKG